MQTGEKQQQQQKEEEAHAAGCFEVNVQLQRVREREIGRSSIYYDLMCSLRQEQHGGWQRGRGRGAAEGQLKL